MKTRLEITVDVIRKLGKHRAAEYANPQVPPTPNPLGEGFTGVDKDGRKYRARIGVCNALSGVQQRITLGRSEDPNLAAYMYRAAHVALYGAHSWAADSLTEAERYVVESTRRACLVEEAV